MSTILRKFKIFIPIIKKIPFLRDLASYFVRRSAFSKKKLKGFLSGYIAYIFDPKYISEENFQEPYIIEFLKDYIKKNDIVFDIGAHFGYYTLLSRKLVGNGGRVVAFEPSPIPLEYLKKNIKLNYFNNVKVESSAVSNQKGFFFLYYSGFGGTMSSLMPSSGLPFKQKVLSVSLDDYCAQNKIYPHFIKIDVEGAELLVIKGARKLLDKNIEILLELHYKQLSKNEINELLFIFQKRGYRIYAIFPNKKESYLIKDMNTFMFPCHIFITKKLI